MLMPERCLGSLSFGKTSEGVPGKDWGSFFFFFFPLYSKGVRSSLVGFISDPPSFVWDTRALESKIKLISRTALVVKCVKAPALSLQWRRSLLGLRFIPGPGTSTSHVCSQKKIY